MLLSFGTSPKNKWRILHDHPKKMMIICDSQSKKRLAIQEVYRDRHLHRLSEHTTSKTVHPEYTDDENYPVSQLN